MKRPDLFGGLMYVKDSFKQAVQGSVGYRQESLANAKVAHDSLACQKRILT